MSFKNVFSKLDTMAMAHYLTLSANVVLGIARFIDTGFPNKIDIYFLIVMTILAFIYTVETYKATGCSFTKTKEENLKQYELRLRGRRFFADKLNKPGYEKYRNVIFQSRLENFVLLFFIFSVVYNNNSMAPFGLFMVVLIFIHSINVRTQIYFGIDLSFKNYNQEIK